MNNNKKEAPKRAKEQVRSDIDHLRENIVRDALTTGFIQAQHLVLVLGRYYQVPTELLDALWDEYDLHNPLNMPIPKSPVTSSGYWFFLVMRWTRADGEVLFRDKANIPLLSLYEPKIGQWEKIDKNPTMANYIRLTELTGYIENIRRYRSISLPPLPEILFQQEIDVVGEQDSDASKKTRHIIVHETVNSIEEIGRQRVELVFKKKNGIWYIGKKDRERLDTKDLDGFFYLHQILDHWPLRVESVELYSLRARSNENADLEEHPEDVEISVPKECTSMNTMPLEMTDNKAIGAVKKRIREINEEKNEAIKVGNKDKVDALEKEKEQCEQYIKNTLDRRGKIRKEKGYNNRARENVTKAISRALEHLQKNHPEVTKYLNRSTIRTGYSCYYDPISSPGMFWLLY